MIGLGSIVCGKYKIVDEIGEGGMGIVYEAEGPSGDRVAVKVPNLSGVNPVDYVVKKLQYERDVLKSLNHPHIVKYIDECDEGQIPVLVVELINGSGLEKCVGQLDVEVALKLGVKLAEVLQYLHRNRIIHRDFRINNVMLRNNNPLDPVVIDMGTAININIARGGLTRFQPYDDIPPELTKTQPEAKEASDIYMWGTIMMKVVKRKGQWRSLDEIKSGDRLKGEPCDHIDCGAYANVLNKVLSKALDPDYKKRYQSVDELLRDLKDVLDRLPDAYLYVNGEWKELMRNKEYVIGRKGDIEIEDNIGYVDCKHARIRYDKRTNSWVVEDLCSTNGTLVIRNGNILVVYEGHRGNKWGRGKILTSGKMCGRRMELWPGDEIVLAFKQGNRNIHYIKVKFDYLKQVNCTN